MAHVRTVGQIVMAIKPREQRIEIGCFQAGAARRVEHRLFRIGRLQLHPDLGKGLVPITSDIAVDRSVIAHRVRQSPDALERMVGPSAQFGDAMTGKEIGRAAMRGQFPECRLCTVFAEFEGVRVLGFAPCAAGAHKPAGLVLRPQRGQRTRRGFFPHHRFGHSTNRTPATCRSGIAGRSSIRVIAVFFRHRGSNALSSPR